MGIAAGKQMSPKPSGTVGRLPGRGLSAGLWTVQTILALLFVFSGLMKFMMPAEQMTKNSSLPLWFFYFIGVSEVLGGIGLVLPALLRIMPLLTPLAASCLVVIMMGATVTSWPMGAVAALPAVIGVLCAFVAYGRFRLRPVAPKA